MQTTYLPIVRRRVIRDDRTNTLIHFRFDDKDSGTPLDLSAYTLAGSASLPDGSGAVAISFANDLPGGVIKGLLTEANSTALVAAAVAAGINEIEYSNACPLKSAELPKNKNASYDHTGAKTTLSPADLESLGVVEYANNMLLAY